MKFKFVQTVRVGLLAACLLLGCFATCGCRPTETPPPAESTSEGDVETMLGSFSVKGKKVAFVGDGFTCGTGLADNEKTYIDFLAEKTGLVPMCLAQEFLSAGDVNRHKESKDHDETSTLSYVINENKASLADCDIMVLWVGTQDYHFSIEPGTPDDTETDTFSGGINYALKSYREANPNGEIVLVTPLYRTAKSGRNAALNLAKCFLLDYREAMISLAVKYGTYLFDPYYLFDSHSLPDYSEDGLYVNTEGHEKIAAAMIENTLSLVGCENLSDAYAKMLPADSILNPVNAEGKTFVFYGDSITARAGFATTDLDYIQRMQSKLGFTYRNFAIGGTTYAPYNAFASNLLPGLVNGHAIANINKRCLVNATADVAFLMYGTNDYNFALEIGEVGTDDTKTVCGAVQLAIDTLKAQNPNIQIVIGTPIARAMGADNKGLGLQNALGYLLEDYVESIAAVAEANGVWLCRMDRLFTYDLYTFDVKMDDVHANPNGHKLMADYMLFNTVYTGN